MNEIEIKKKREAIVVKSNDFVRKARYKLTATQQKLILYVISLIDKDDTDFKLYEIKVADFCEVCGIDKTYFYTEFKELIDDIDSKSEWVEIDGEAFKFRWFLKAKYLMKKGTVKLMLDDDLKRYLLQQHEYFTSYELFYALALSGKYSIRLYELLKSYQFMGKVISIEINELKRCLGAEKYINFKDFRINVLDTAINEINTYTDIVVMYERETYGKKVIGIKFTIKENLLNGKNFARECAQDKLDRKEWE